MSTSRVDQPKLRAARPWPGERVVVLAEALALDHLREPAERAGPPRSSPPQRRNPGSSSHAGVDPARPAPAAERSASTGPERGLAHRHRRDPVRRAVAPRLQQLLSDDPRARSRPAARAARAAQAHVQVETRTGSWSRTREVPEEAGVGRPSSARSSACSQRSARRRYRPPGSSPIRSRQRPQREGVEHVDEYVLDVLVVASR